MQGGIADVFDQAGEDGSRLHQLALAAALRQQVGGSAGDDEFADQIDELIEFVGLDADGAGFDGFLFLDAGLFAGSGFDDFLLHHLLFDEDFTDRRSRFVTGAALL